MPASSIQPGYPHDPSSPGNPRLHRWDLGGLGDDVVVVLNFANRAVPDYRIGFPRHGTWSVRFNSDWTGYSPDFWNYGGHPTVAHPTTWQGLPFSANIAIAPYSALILSQ